MLENWIKPQIPEEEELDERLHAARSKLSVLQMQIKEHGLPVLVLLSLIHISEPTRPYRKSRMPSSA